MNTWNDFENYYSKIKNATTILELLSWDQEVFMPPHSSSQRADQMSYLHTHIHQMKTSEAYIDLIQKLSQRSELSAGQKSTLKRHLKDSIKAKKVPEKLVSDIAEATVKAQQSWKNAKDKANFNLFKDDLKKIFELQKHYAECIRDDGQPLYEALMSEYEPDFPISKIRNIFSGIKKDLVPLAHATVEKYHQKNKQKDQINLSLNLSDQKALNQMVAEKIGFDLSRGRIDESAHPFCSGSFEDVRLTTRFKEDDWTNSLYSVLHEAGHGMYEQGIGKKIGKSAAASVPSLGIHESQSRFWENCIGRSRAFSRFMGPMFSSLHPDKKITPNQYYDHVNSPDFTYIRVDSDELTYNLHILIRYEIEEALFSNTIQIDELPMFWDSKVKEYLMLPRISDSLGVLQDVHWSCGSFGYFPTYTIGNIIAAELDSVLRKKQNLDQLIEEGKFLEIRNWLNENIHSVGLKKTTLETIEGLTGRELGVSSFIDYLKKKFT